MQVETTRFGKLDVREDEVFHFDDGLVGLLKLKRFILVDHPSGGPFQWLQSLDAPEMAFVVASPRAFFPDYQVTVESELLEGLGFDDPSAAVVLVTLMVPSDARQITANLKGPLVIDLKIRRGLQLVLNEPQYHTRHSIFAARKEAIGAGVGDREGE